LSADSALSAMCRDLRLRGRERKLPLPNAGKWGPKGRRGRLQKELATF